MSSTVVALVVLACLMAGALLGLALQSVLPEHHLGADSKEAVRLAGGVTASVAALVLGLLIASASGSFTTRGQEIQTAAARIILLDDVLALYGPEAGRARDLLRRSVDAAVARIGTRTAAARGTRSRPAAPATACSSRSRDYRPGTRSSKGSRPRRSRPRAS